MFNPIMAKIYQASGGAPPTGGAGSYPGHSGESATGPGPKVDEVD
jgi:hypothetical protein